MEGTASNVSDVLGGKFESKELAVLMLHICGSYSLTQAQLLLSNSCALVTQNSGLRHFHFSFSRKSPRDSTPWRLHLTSLLAIRSMIQITDLRLEFSNPISLSNDELYQFARALPNLQVLRFGWTSVVKPEVAPNLEALKILCACPMLHTLQLYIDATEGSVASYETCPYPLVKQLQRISFGTSPIDVDLVIAVTVYLSQFIPSADVFEAGKQPTRDMFGNLPGDGGQSLAVALERWRRWKQVRDALPALVRIQKTSRAAIDELQSRVNELEKIEMARRLFGSR